MGVIKHTKTELKVQKDTLKRYLRYLPTLQLKQQQLQLVISRIRALQHEVAIKQERFTAKLEKWVALFCEENDFTLYIALKKVNIGIDSIAGVDIPVFEGVEFTYPPYDAVSTPLWIDVSLKALNSSITYTIQLSVYEEALRKLNDELRITTQRVNLFEKVRIPETQENIRTIRIFLSDQQTAEVVRGKLAKKKIMARAL